MTCVDDLRARAARRVPRAFFEYADHGSYSQSTLRANRDDLAALGLRQRVGIDVGERTLSTHMAGEPVSLPFGLGPIGLCGMQVGNGEILACRAAQAAGIPFCLSTMSVCSIEDVAAAVHQPFWFQLYVMRDRGFVRSLVQRARDAGCSALVVTVDLNMLGQRHCDIRNGLAVPPRITPGNVLDALTRPRWAWSVLRAERRTFGNLAGQIRGMDDVSSLAEWVSRQFDPTLSWKDFEWIRQVWPGKIIVKGILDPGDAALAVKTGASALVVSNHGGRQLDGAPSSVGALPRIADAVGSDLEVIFDGGIRSGQDVLRALALGARSCLLGRAYVYGLGAGGQAGVTRTIEIIRDELDVTMALTGTTSVTAVGRDVIAGTWSRPGENR